MHQENIRSKQEINSPQLSERIFTSVELFAGCGGLALGLEEAGFTHILLNDFDRDAFDIGEEAENRK